MTVFEETSGHSSEDEPADVCQVRHSASLYLRDGSSVHQLDEEPDTDQQGCRNERDPHKNEDKKNRFDPIPRVGHEERTP